MQPYKQFEDIRTEMFEIYEKEYKKKNDRKDSLDIANEYLDNLFNQFPHKVLGKRWKSGLLTEISFYSEYLLELKLTRSLTRIDKYFKTDFIGEDPITKQKILIDVTNSLTTKLSKIDDYYEVCENLKLINKSLDYRIVWFNNKSFDYKLSPLMLPVHPDRYLGYYVLTLTQDKFNVFGDLSLIYLDPKDPTEIFDYNSNIQNYVFYFDSVLNKLYDETYYFIEEELSEMYEDTQYDKIEKEVEKSVIDVLSDSRQYFFKFIREQGVVLSSIIEPRHFYDKPRDDAYSIFYTTWVHPLKPIKMIFGDILSDLEHIGNIEDLYW